MVADRAGPVGRTSSF